MEDRTPQQRPRQSHLSCLFEGEALSGPRRPSQAVEAELALLQQALEPVLSAPSCSAEVVHQLLQGVIQLHEITGRTGVSFPNLEAALNSTWRCLYDLGDIRPELVHLAHRQRWLRAEITDAALLLDPQNENHDCLEKLGKECRLYREIFAENEHGVPYLWQLQWDRSRERLQTDIAHTALRRFASALDRLEASLTIDEKVDAKDGANRGARLVDAIQAELAPAFYSMPDGVESPKAQLIESLALTILTLSRTHPPHELLQSARERLLSEGVFAVPQSVSRHLSLAEFRPESPPPVEVLRRLEAINRGLVIDLNRLEPQEGFGAPVTREDMENWLKVPSLRWVTLSIDGVIHGHYSLFTREDEVPFPGNAAMRAAGPRGRSEVRGFVPHIAMTVEGRAWCAERGISGADLLYAAAEETGREAHLDTLIAFVRGGPQANTAIRKHLARRYQPTGSEITLHGTPCPVLRLDLYEPLVDGLLRDLQNWQ